MASHLSPVSPASEASRSCSAAPSPCVAASGFLSAGEAPLSPQCRFGSDREIRTADFGSSVSLDEVLASSPTTPRSVFTRDQREHSQCLLPAVDESSSSRPIPLLDHERNMLDAFCSQSEKRQKRRITLIANISKVGNAAYIPARHILVEWMFDLCQAFNLQNTTLHAAIHYVDVYMSRCRCTQRSWQLLAASALFVAAKFEENADAVPSLKEIRSVCGNPVFTIDCVKSMELLILDAFGWNPLYRGSIHFLGLSLNILRRLHDEADQDCQVLSPISSNDEEDVPEKYVSSKKRARDAEAVDSAVYEDLLKIRKTNVGGYVGSSRRIASPSRSLPGPAVDVASPAVENTRCLLNEQPGGAIDLDDAGRMANCILDSTLYDPVLCAVQDPRHLAAAALFIARQLQGAYPAWDDACVTATGLIETDFSSCTALLTYAVRNADSSTTMSCQI